MKDRVVLQIVPSMNSGGVEQATLDISGAIVKAGGRGLVATSGGRLVDKLEAVGAETFLLPLNTKNPFKIFLNIFRLSKVIDLNRVDIVHARSRAPAWSSFFAARRCNVIFITTYHGAYSGTSPWKNYYNSIMTKGIRVIANSSFTAETIIKKYRLSPKRVITIPRGISKTEFDPEAVSMQRQKRILNEWGITEEPRELILLPARFSRWKGHTVLIEAANHLRSFGHKNFICILAGDSRGRDTFVKELKLYIEKLKLNGIVKIVGHCSDMPAALATSTVVVSASTEPEAFGRVAVEAQAMARPVIVADHGATRETVINGETGWRVAPGDSYALAQALDATLSLSTAVRAQSGQNGRDRVLKYYSVEQMCNKTINLYNELSGGPFEQEQA